MQTILKRQGTFNASYKRFEALSSDEMLSSGTSEERDYEGEILLERFWREHPANLTLCS
jgi:hypothetical protein